MSDRTKRKILERVCRYVRSRYELVKVEPSQGLFNFRCYENAVEHNRIHGTEVFEVIYIDDGYPMLHYINKSVDGGFLETTLGWKAKHMEYYIVRRIHPDDYEHIAAEFNRSLESWLEQFTTWFQRKVLGIDRVL